MQETEQNTRPRRAIVIIDHGSRNPPANAVVEDIARIVQEQAGARALVRFAHMEICEPGLGAAIEQCVVAGAREVFVQPLFLVPGKHAERDLPALLADAQRRHPGVVFQLGSVIGADPVLAELVSARCGLSAGAPGLVAWPSGGEIDAATAAGRPRRD